MCVNLLTYTFNFKLVSEMINVTLKLAAEVTDFDEKLLQLKPRGWGEVNREEMLLSWENRRYIDGLRRGYGQDLLKAQAASLTGEKKERKERKERKFTLPCLVAESTKKFPLIYPGPTPLHSLPVSLVNESSHEGTAAVLDR
jgi:hypothetical protein